MKIENSMGTDLLKGGGKSEVQLDGFQFEMWYFLKPIRKQLCDLLETAIMLVELDVCESEQEKIKRPHSSQNHSFLFSVLFCFKWFS